MTSEELRQWLISHNMTVQQLAEALPVSRRTLEGWLHRGTAPEYLGRALSDIARERSSVAVEQSAAPDALPHPE